MSEVYGNDVIGEPTPDEVVQSEVSDLPRTVPVTVETPVRVQQLCSPESAVGNVTVTSDPGNTTKQIAPRDPRRRRLLIDVSGGNDIWVAFNQQAAAQGLGYKHRAAITTPLELFTEEAVYVSLASGSSALICFLIEQWTN